MREETSQQGLPTTTGFAAREAIALLRKHNIAAAPLLLRAGLSEHGLARAADEGNGLPQRVSAIGQCKFLEYAAEAMEDSAFGLHLAKQIRSARCGLYFYASSAWCFLAISSAKRSRSFRAIAGSRTRRFRLTQRSAGLSHCRFRVCGPRQGMPSRCTIWNTSWRALGRSHCERCQAATSPQRKSRSPFTTGIPDLREFERFFELSWSSLARRNTAVSDLSRCSLRLPLITADPKLFARPSTLLRCCCQGAERKTGNTALCG